MKRVSLWLGAMLVALWSGACAEQEAPLVEARREGAVGAPFDVGGVIRQVRRTFRRDTEGWSGSLDTYSVRATRHGLTVRPYQQEEATPVLEGLPITFGPALIWRGDERLDVDHAGGEVQPDGALALGQGEVREWLRNGEEGVEQSWEFAEPPRGEGELRVTLAVNGLEYVGETAGGLHFADPETHLGVRYGHGTWIDAEGRRTEVPARYVEGQVVLRVPAEVVATSTWPAVLDPIISPERGVDQPLLNPANSGQLLPAVAAGAGGFLLVWQDHQRTPSDIHGARVDATGKLLDPTGFVISDASGGQLAPTVAFDGTNFLVAWADGRHAGNGAIYAARVSGAGAVLEPSGILVSRGSLPKSLPSVAHNGTSYLIVWEEMRTSTNSDIYAARVNNAGTVLDASARIISSSTAHQTEPVVAAGGGQFLVAWSEVSSGTSWWKVSGARVSGEGLVLGTAGLPLSSSWGHASAPAVAYDGANFLVVWSDTRGGSAADIYGTRVSPTGIVLNSSNLAITTAAGTQGNPAVAHDGTRYLVVWEQGSSPTKDLRGARVSNTGTVLDSAGFDINKALNEQEWPVVAGSAQAGFLVVWNDRVSGLAQDVSAARVSGDGVLRDPNGFLISQSSNAQEAPAVAYDGKNYLVVWKDNRNGNGDIYGVRVSVEGTPVEPTGFPIARASTDQQTPAVACHGTRCLVVWADARGGMGYWDIYGARVDGNGVVLDPGGLVVSTATNHQMEPAVAFDGANFLVVWEDWRSGQYIYGARVSGAGTVFDPNGFVVSAMRTNAQQVTPSIASVGNQSLVVWSDRRTGDNQIYARRVSQAGVPLGAVDLQLSSGTGTKYNPAVAADPSSKGFLAVWENWGVYPYRLFTTRVDANGNALNPGGVALVSTTTALQRMPSVAHDGTGFLVLWADERPPSYDIQGLYVGTDGKPVDAPFVVSAEAPRESAPVLASGAKDRVLVAYHVGSSFSGPPMRVRARTISRVIPNVPPVAHPTQLTTAEDQPLQLSLSGSDPEGKPLTFTLVSSPAHGTLTGVPPTLTYTPAANYHGTDGFSFTVNDGTDSSTPATVSLTVTPVNDVPVAYGQAHTVHAGASLELTLTGSDVDGDALGFQVLSGPSVGTLSGTPPLLTYTAPEGFRGPVSFSFVANDGGAASAPATVSLEVYKPLPVVSVTADVLAPLEGQAVHFTSTVSAPGGGPVRYAWDFGDGTRSSEPSPTHVFPDEGPYQVTLVVADLLDQVQTGLVLSVRNADPHLPAQPPVAVDEGTAVTLSSQASDPGVGDVLTVTWDFGDGSAPATGLEVTHTYAEDGEYQVRLTVTDGDGGSASSLRTVVVRNTAPVPVPVARQEVWMGQKFSLRLTASDAAGDRDPLHWALVSGPGAVDASGLYTWHATRAGEHTVTVRVTDDEGGSSLLVFLVRATPGRHLAKGHAELAAP